MHEGEAALRQARKGGGFRALCRRESEVEEESEGGFTHRVRSQCSVLFTDAEEFREHTRTVHADWVRQERRMQARQFPNRLPELPLIKALPTKRPRVRPAVAQARAVVQPGQEFRAGQGLHCQVIGHTARDRVALLVTVPDGSRFHVKGMEFVDHVEDGARYRVVQPADKVARAVKKIQEQE